MHPSHDLAEATVEPTARRAELEVAHLRAVALDEGRGVALTDGLFQGVFALHVPEQT
jgi:hypothetical protein